MEETAEMNGICHRKNHSRSVREIAICDFTE